MNGGLKYSVLQSPEIPVLLWGCGKSKNNGIVSTAQKTLYIAIVIVPKLI